MLGSDRQQLDVQRTIERAVRAWTDRRNAATTQMDWQFTTADARTKLRRLYPAFDD
jgi:hypothetical protein